MYDEGPWREKENTRTVTGHIATRAQCVYSDTWEYRPVGFQIGNVHYMLLTYQARVVQIDEYDI